jgi:hypothetical protein
MEKQTRVRNYQKQERCDCCGKWVEQYDLSLLPEETWKHLNGDNEFAICIPCANDVEKDLNYWLTWIERKRNKQ